MKNSQLVFNCRLLSALLAANLLAASGAFAQGADASEYGIYFAKKKYVPEALPLFNDVRNQLPEPVIPSHPEWQAMYWKCWQLAFSHIEKPPAGSPFVSNWMDASFSDGIFQWDTIFIIMFARYGEAEFPSIQSLDNFYARQHPSGFICREIRKTDGKEIHFDFDGGVFATNGWKNTVNPPLFSWAECENFKVTGDKSRFAAVLPVLEKYTEWLDQEGDPAASDWEANGRRCINTPHELYWNTPLGCGMDNTPRPIGKGCGWVDMSCQMAMQYNDIATICRELGQNAKAKAAEAKARAISERINRWCWDETDGFYYDVNAKGEKFKVKTAAGFWPLIAGVASKSQAARLVEHLKNPKEFWRPFVFPTLAADEPGYDPKGGYWLGGVWAPTDYAIIKGLERYGYDAFAAEASEKYLAAMAVVFKKTGTVWENYAPESMNPGNPAKSDFVGWTGCGPIALLIENVMGFRPDGVRKTLNWDLRLSEAHGINRLRFGEVQTDIHYDGNGTVTIVASDPYTLCVNGETFKIKQGRSSIKATPSNSVSLLTH